LNFCKRKKKISQAVSPLNSFGKREKEEKIAHFYFFAEFPLAEKQSFEIGV